MNKFYKFITIKSPMDEFLFNKPIATIIYIVATIIAVNIGIEAMLEYNSLIAGILSFSPMYIIGFIFVAKAFFQK